MSQVVCLYHYDCFDGTGSAWALLKRFPDAEFHQVRYGEPFPQGLEGKSVYIVDFCYPLQDLLALSLLVEELHIFDHHKGMDSVVSQFNETMAFLAFDTTKFRGVFDHNRSGALITWEELMPEHPVPAIIQHISDRDLWRFELEETEAVMSGLGTYKLDLRTWDRLFRWDDQYSPDDPTHGHFVAVNSFETDGQTVLRKMKIDIERLIGLSLRSIVLEGHEVPLVNLPRTLISEALEVLAVDQPFAAAYFDTAEHRIFSLRSSPEGLDVIPIAKALGGGGHPNAAGFRVGREHPLAQI